MENYAVILIIPSASYRTGPFMNAVKKLDLKVLVISDKSQVFSGKYPDNLIIINFNHWQDRSDEISKWAKNNGLKAVIGVDEESIVLAANISNFLNVEHNPVESVLLTKDKYLMRNELLKLGIKSPWFKRFSIYESTKKIINEISFPCVIKPTFLSASRGVMRVNTMNELSDSIKIMYELLSLDELRKRGGEQSDWILFEEYIPGNEVAVEGLVTNGKLTVLAVFDKPEPLEGPTFEETIIVTPSVLTKEIQYSLLETIQNVVKALGILKGPIHAEARINKNGNYILECASRSIGGLCSKVLEFQGGMSLEELILRSYLGRNIEKSKLTDKARGVMMMPTEKMGILKEMRGVQDALNVKGITDLKLTVKPGEKLEPLPKGDRYLGFIFAEGNDQKLVIKALKNAWSKITVVQENT
tara:strand:- start:1091 stop:2335 length:1245 start_codon:yes stop_codon:yes gene_type:complete